MNPMSRRNMRRWKKIMISTVPASSAFPVAEAPTPRKRFLHVVFLNGSERWYELDDKGWRFDAMTRELVIGKGKSRKHVPLDNVEYYSPE